MKIRLMGLPDEVETAVDVIARLAMVEVLQVSDPYPNRGDSRMVRVYVDAQFSEWVARSWLIGDRPEGSLTGRLARYHAGQLPSGPGKPVR